MQRASYQTAYDAELATRTLIKNDNQCEAFFYTELETKGAQIIGAKLQLITINPKHNTPFLLYSIDLDPNLAKSRRTCYYNRMYDYVYNVQKGLNKKGEPLIHYTIEWENRSGQVQTSYFSGTSLQNILIKFNYGKSPPPTIFKLQLKPSKGI